MKVQKLLSLFLVVCAISFTSCNKEYTCECDGTSGGLEVETYVLKSESEADAKTTCDSYAEGTGGLVVCVLK